VVYHPHVSFVLKKHCNAYIYKDFKFTYWLLEITLMLCSVDC